MRQFSYNLIFRPELEGGYTVLVPALPGCITYGATIEEAKVNANDAIEGYLVSLAKHGETIPSDDASLISSIRVQFTGPADMRSHAQAS